MDSDGESSKQPGQAKEEHDSSYADHESDEGLGVEGFLLPGHGPTSVFEEDGYHHNVHHHVKDDDGKDGTQERHKEHNSVAQETAVDRNNYKHQDYFLEIARFFSFKLLDGVNPS